jgi:hypothetical protein
MVPVVREQTVKSVLTLVTKLPDRTINGELLKHLAKTSNDEQPGIRTNTTICLGKIARNLGPNVSFQMSVSSNADKNSRHAPRCSLQLSPVPSATRSCMLEVPRYKLSRPHLICFPKKTAPTNSFQLCARH